MLALLHHRSGCCWSLGLRWMCQIPLAGTQRCMQRRAMDGWSAWTSCFSTELVGVLCMCCCMRCSFVFADLRLCTCHWLSVPDTFKKDKAGYQPADLARINKFVDVEQLFQPH